MGHRLRLPHTRALLRAALGGKLDGVPTRQDAVFGLEVPTACPDVPAAILSPRTTWPKPEAYDAQAERLAALFRKNFDQFGDAPPGVREGGPKVV
jgi:phosphoenolpyruvate carboxykinase (ATP)